MSLKNNTLNIKNCDTCHRKIVFSFSPEIIHVQIMYNEFRTNLCFDQYAMSQERARSIRNKVSFFNSHELLELDNIKCFDIISVCRAWCTQGAFNLHSETTKNRWISRVYISGFYFNLCVTDITHKFMALANCSAHT